MFLVCLNHKPNAQPRQMPTGVTDDTMLPAPQQQPATLFPIAPATDPGPDPQLPNVPIEGEHPDPQLLNVPVEGEHRPVNQTVTRSGQHVKTPSVFKDFVTHK